MTTLRLLADDLTGALDTAAQFVGLAGRVPVFWQATRHDGSAAFDSATREMSAGAAESVVASMAEMIAPSPGSIAFKKIDSLLRGHSGRELAACLRLTTPRHCIIAPAFPFQRRVTREGLQFVPDANGWRKVGEDLRTTLVQAGWTVTPATPGDPLPPGISLWDAESDADLGDIARVGRAAGGSVLWCGSSGLAGALAGTGQLLSPSVRRPVLGLFGSDHPATAAQLRAAREHCLMLQDGGPGCAARLCRRLDETGAALAMFALAPGLSRDAAGACIARAMRRLVASIAAPRTLIVAGGETLRAVCLLLGADRLDVQGQIMPGIPQSVLRGGLWDGVTVISKSGAFGEAGLLHDLLAAPPTDEEPGS